MPEKSFVGKVEQNVEDLSKVHRRKPWLFYLLVAGFLLFAVLYVIEKFWGIPKLRQQISSQKEEIGELRRDRDAKASQLTPFLAVANKQFQDPTESERLKKLLQQIEEVTVQMKQVSEALPKPRKIDDATAMKFVEAMKQASNYEAYICFESNQRESAQFANQLKELFTKAGWKVPPLIPKMSLVAGESLIVSTKNIPPEPVLIGIVTLLDALHLPRHVNTNANLPEHQVMINVGIQ